MLNFMLPNFWNVLRNVWFEEVRVNCMQVGCPIKTNNVRQLCTLAGHASGHLENLSGSTVIQRDREKDAEFHRRCPSRLAESCLLSPALLDRVVMRQRI